MHADRRLEQEHGGQHRQRREQHQEPVVVERLGQQPPDRGADRRPGSRRSARAPPRARGRAPRRCRRACRSARGRTRGSRARRGCRARAAGRPELDLVGRVVREEPGGGRVAQAELQERRGRHQQHADGEHERDPGPPRPGPRPRPSAAPPPRRTEARRRRPRARDAHIPLLARRRARAARAAPADRPPLAGSARGRAELGQGDRDQAEQDPARGSRRRCARGHALGPSGGAPCAPALARPLRGRRPRVVGPVPGEVAGADGRGRAR